MIRFNAKVIPIHERFNCNISVVIKGDQITKKQKDALTFYNKGDDCYFNFDASPFFIIDLNSIFTKKYNLSLSVSFVKSYIYIIIQELQKLEAVIRKQDSFFYDRNNVLRVNQIMQEENIVRLYGLNGKSLVLMPDVITVGNNLFEGVYVEVDGQTPSSYLTHTELSSLILELCKLDLNSITMNAINIVMTQINKMTLDELNKKIITLNQNLKVIWDAGKKMNKNIINLLPEETEEEQKQEEVKDENSEKNETTKKE